MLSLFLSLDLLIFAPFVLLSYAPSATESIFAMRLRRLRLTLRVWSLLILILTIEFAVNSFFWRRDPEVFIPICACDAALVILSTSLMARVRTTPRDLMALGYVVAIMGLASLALTAGY
jgi:hypothetical protein